MRANFGAWAARWRVPLGFIFAIVYAAASRPTPALLAVGGAVTLAGLALRGFAAGCIDKDQKLATAGPFRYTRNPLYLGSFILGGGFMIAGGSLTLSGAFAALFFMIYIPVMRQEETTMRHRFGSAYQNYAAKTPLFLPRLPRAAGNGGRFRWKQYWKNREYEAAAGWMLATLLLITKLLLP